MQLLRGSVSCRAGWGEGPATRDPSQDPSQDPSLALPQQENRSFAEKLPNCSGRSDHSCTNQVAPELGSLSGKAGETLCPILVLGAEEAPVCTPSLALAQHFEEHQLFRTVPAVLHSGAALSRAVGRAALMPLQLLDLELQLQVDSE